MFSIQKTVRVLHNREKRLSCTKFKAPSPSSNPVTIALVKFYHGEVHSHSNELNSSDTFLSFLFKKKKKSLRLLLQSAFHGLQCLPSLLCFSSHLDPWLLHNQQDTGYCELKQLKLAGIKERGGGRRERVKWNNISSVWTDLQCSSENSRLHFVLTLLSSRDKLLPKTAFLCYSLLFWSLSFKALKATLKHFQQGILFCINLFFI